MKRGELLLLSLLLVACGSPSATDSGEVFRPIHHALFETYLPQDPDDGLLNDPRLAQMEQASFETLSRFPDVRRLWAGLDQLVLLRTLGVHSRFQDLPLAERWPFLDAMQQSAPGMTSQVANTVRLLYLTGLYGSAWGDQVSGNEGRSVLVPPGIARAVPVFPTSRIRYDAQKSVVLPRDAERFDYLIIGSGPAGAVLAHELSVRGGQRVLLVDRGAFVQPDAVNTRAADPLLESRGTRLSDDGGIPFANGNTVGGGSAVNLDLAFSPLSDSVQHQIALWRQKGNIEPSRFSVTELSAAYDWVKQTVGTRELETSEMNGNNRVLWRGALALGYKPSLYDLNTFPPGQWKGYASDKRSATLQLILPALQNAKNPLSLLSDADVTKIVFEGDRAIGCEFTFLNTWDSPGVIADLNGLEAQGLAPGQTARVYADNVILSAGTLGSATLLLKSGVANPLIGKRIVVHPAIPVIGVFEKPVHVWEGLTNSVFLDQFAVDKRFIFEAMTAPPEYGALMFPGNPRQTYDFVKAYPRLAGFGPMIIDASAESNQIYLDHGQPQIHYVMTESDQASVRGALAMGVKIMLAAGASRVIIPAFQADLRADLEEGSYFTRPEQADLILKKLKVVPNLFQLTSAHLQSSNRMGLDPSTSVVSSKDFHVWGKQNLFVMDSSVFPTSVGANPMQSIYTFAKLYADQIVGAF